MPADDTQRPPSRMAIRVGRAVPALQANLVRALPLRPVNEELRIEGNPAVRFGVELHHPPIDPFRVELLVDGPVKRIGEIDAPSVAADLDHLWAAIELA